MNPAPEKKLQEPRIQSAGCMGFASATTPEKKVKRLANKFGAVVKPLTKKGTPGRERLQRGSLIVALLPKDLPPRLRGAEPVEVTQSEILQNPHAVLWWHIGLMYFSPWRPTFHVLVPPSAGATGAGCVSLTATAEFASSMPMFASLDLEREWWVCLFEVLESQAPCLDFVPGKLCAVPMSSPMLLWSPRRQARAGAAHGPRRPPPSGGAGGPSEEFDDDDIFGDAALALEDVDTDLVVGEDEESADAEEYLDLEKLLAEALALDMGEDEPAAPEATSRQAEEPLRVEEPAGGPIASASSAQVADSPQPLGELAMVAIGQQSAPLPSGPGPSGASAASSSPAPPLAAYYGRRAGLDSVRLYGGQITYYPATMTSKARFQAICPMKDVHGTGCQLTRSAHAAEGRSKGREAQGRPLGMMAAWLSCSSMCETKHQHEAMIATVTLEHRREARAHLLLQPGGPAVAAQERALRPGELDEPHGCA